jgi:hypothetical protein
LPEKVYFLKVITCEVKVAASKYVFGINNSKYKCSDNFNSQINNAMTHNIDETLYFSVSD